MEFFLTKYLDYNLHYYLVEHKRTEHSYMLKKKKELRHGVATPGLKVKFKMMNSYNV
jgi:hypothetical protein